MNLRLENWELIFLIFQMKSHLIRHLIDTFEIEKGVHNEYSV